MKKLLCLGLLLCGLAMAQGQGIVNFTIDLSGTQEVPLPATPSGATGSGTAVYDSLANTISINVTYGGLSNNPSGAHIHLGAFGVGGGIIAQGFTIPAATSGTITGTVPFPVGNQADLLAGNTYFNIHSQPLYGGGEIRGQLVVVPEPSTLALTGLGAAALVFWWRRRPQVSMQK